MGSRNIALVVNAIFLCAAVSKCEKPCTVYDADTGKIVTNYTSVAKLRVDCSMRGLHMIPKSLPERTYILDLHGNHIWMIPAFAFKLYFNMTHLHLSDNWISKLDPNSFRGLTKLEVLNLSGNNLCLPQAYPDGIFQDLMSLKVLKTYGNHCPQRHKSIPDQVFKDLISLEKLTLDATDELLFGDGFTKLTQLTDLEVSSFNNCMSYHTVIYNASFSGLRNSKLTQLTLRGCAYRNIEGEALTVLPNLNTLNTACMRNMNKASLFKAIYNMNESTLETLVLDGMQGLSRNPYLDMIKKALKTLDQRSLIQFLKKFANNTVKDESVPPLCHPNFLNLKRLSVRENLIVGKFNLQHNGKSCLPNLNHINIGMNTIFDLLHYSGTDYELAKQILKQGIPTDIFWSLSNIRTVDASDLFFNSLYDTNWFCSQRDLDTEDLFRKAPKFIQEIPDLEDNFEVKDGYVKSKGTVNVTNVDSFKGVAHAISVSPGTQVLFVDHAVPDVLIDPATKHMCPYVMYPFDTFTFVNLSNNPIDLLTCPVVGARNLRVLDASFCGVKSIHTQFFVPNLTILYARGNPTLNNTHEFPEIFSKPMKLKELDLALNGFHSLPDKSFEKLIHLEKLDLSGNVLTAVNLSLSNLTQLKQLDLSFNMMPYLEEPFLKQVEHLSHISPEFRLHLLGNPFTCDCNSVPFLNWLKATTVKMDNVKSMTCPNSTTPLSEVDTTKLAASCKVSYFEYYVIIGSLSTSVLFLIVSSLVMYRKRWKIAWYVYTMKRRLLHNKYETLDETETEKYYKAFVAYHIDHEIGNDPGITWVKNSLCLYAEEEWGHKLFIFDRNATFGGSKIGETVYGIQQSEKVVFVITPMYLKKGNWEMILYWALGQGLSNVIICCLENMKIDNLPVPLAKVAIQLQEKYPANYLEFDPETCGGMDKWNNLKLALDCEDSPLN